MIAGLVNEMPLAQQFSAGVNRHAGALAWIAGAVTGAGALGLLLGILLPSGAGRRRLRSGEDIYSFKLAALKQAWRQGRGWREPVWRKRSLLFAGGMALVFGVFGLAFALADAPFARAIVGAALLYGVVRLAIGVWRV